jgi:hydroxyacylglutathione hydrolase
MTQFQFGEITLERHSVGPLGENTYFLFDSSKTGFIIDPGDEADRLLSRIHELELKPKAILLTHAHFDHIGAVEPLRLELGIPVFLHPLDLEIYRSGPSSAARYNIPFNQPKDPDRFLEVGQILEAGSIALEVRFVPGHAPGHVVFIGKGFAIAGDTLFRQSIGRTDLPGGNLEQLLSGIRAQIFTLPLETQIFPGHGPETTVDFEKKHNPFLNS